MKGSRTKTDFVDALSYPSKNLRPLGKDPISVPRDPLITSYKPFKGNKTEPKNFFYSLYFTAFDVRDYGGSINKFMKIYAPLSIKKAYLETYRDGYTADRDQLLRVKKALEKSGISVSAGVTTTHFSDRARYNETVSPAGCYSDRAAKRKMKKVFEFSASIFNEIIIDDWYFTICRCPECVKAKSGKTWEEFRGRLLSDAAKKYIIGPAKKINKNVKIILKLPQWYEYYYSNGYDLNRLIPLFDEIAVGTETRDYKKTRFMPVHAAMLFRYIKNLAPGRVKKAWFDSYMCDSEIYMEQAYQSVLGGAEEIILFCAGVMPQKDMRPLVESLIANTGRIDRLSNFKNIFNIPLLRETNAADGRKLNQYLLMAGIPVYITDKKEFREKIIVLTGESSKKPERLRIFNNLIKEGKDIVMTAEFASDMKKYFSVKKLKKDIRVTHIKMNGREHNIRDNIFIKSEVVSGKNLALLNNAYPFVSYFRIKESRVYIINFPATKEVIKNHMGESVSAGYRYLLHSPDMVTAVKNIFKNYANLNLYDKIKTFYKYNV